MYFKIIGVAFLSLASLKILAQEDSVSISKLTVLTLKPKISYMNFSGTDNFFYLNKDNFVSSKQKENINGDGLSLDIDFHIKSLKISWTNSSVLKHQRLFALTSAVTFGKSLEQNRFRLSFSGGVGGIFVSIPNYTIEDNRKTININRLGMVTMADFNYFINRSKTVFLGFQVQSWLGLGDGDDFGTSSAAITVGYDIKNEK